MPRFSNVTVFLTALTMPFVAVWKRTESNGVPIAMTVSPTLTVSESANSAGVNVPSIFITPTSLSES